MKNLLLISILLFWSVAFSQIKTFKYESVKVYDVNKQVAYFTVSKKIDRDQAYFIIKNIVYLDSVDRLTNYYPGNYSKFLVNSQKGIKETTLVDFFNKYISKYDNLYNNSKLDLGSFYSELYNVYDFPQYFDSGNYKNDQDVYENAKQAWIKANPYKFEKIKHLSLDYFANKY